jgi:hypothetical protein
MFNADVLDEAGFRRPEIRATGVAGQRVLVS